MTDYLTIADVLAMHKDQIERYGGGDGLRDPGQLEAAALWENLSQNHPFIDGNKRTAFAATYTFLAINGVKITADADSLWEFLSHLYKTGSLSFESLDEWLRQNTASYLNNKG